MAGHVCEIRRVDATTKANLEKQPDHEHLKIQFVKEATNADFATIKDVAWVRRISLLFNTQIDDISPISALVDLRELDAHQSGVTNIASLAGLQKLESVHLSHDERITDFSPLCGLRELRTLALTETTFSDTSCLAKLPNLNELAAEKPHFKDLSALKGHCALTVLDVDFAKDFDLQSLGGCDALKTLLLYGAELHDLHALPQLKGLEVLNLGANHALSDISDLRRYPGLRELELEDTSIADVAPLSSLTSLEYLDLSVQSSRAKKIPSLVIPSGLKELKQLSLLGYPDLDLTPLADLPALTCLAVDPKVPSATLEKFRAKRPKVQIQTKAACNKPHPQILL